MNPESAWDFSSIYSAWFSISGLLFIVRECHVPIPCNIIGESIAMVGVRLQPEWEIDIPEEFSCRRSYC